MALTTPATQLGCGRDIDQIWDHLDEAPDAHELTCPYCRAARADLAALADATRQLRADEAARHEEPSPQLLERILAVARAEVRRGRRLPLDEPEPGLTSTSTVSEQAVAAVVRRVGDRTGQLQIRRCAIATVAPGEPAAPAGDAVPGPAAAAVAVSLRVSAGANLPVAQVTHALRRDIIDTVAQEVGMRVTSVDILVEDLHDA